MDDLALLSTSVVGLCSKLFESSVGQWGKMHPLKEVDPFIILIKYQLSIFPLIALALFYQSNMFNSRTI